MTDRQHLEDEVFDLLFGVRRSVMYHNRRRAFFDRIRNIKNILSVIFGSATFFSVLTSAGKEYALVASAVIIILSTIDLVVGTSNRSRLHFDLAKRFLILQKAIIGASLPTNEDIQKWTQERLDIEMDEPPVLRVLDSICHNDLCRATGCGQEEFVTLTWYQRLFAQIGDIASYKIKRQESKQELTKQSHP